MNEARLLEMGLFRIRIDENRAEQVISLKEKDGDRILPIIIGANEANAIRAKIISSQHPRPLTHDLLINTIHLLGGKIEKVIVDKLADNIFYAKLVIRMEEDGKTYKIDARPSDAVALAVRVGAPIFVVEEILEKLKSL